MLENMDPGDDRDETGDEEEGDIRRDSGFDGVGGVDDQDDDAPPDLARRRRARYGRNENDEA